MRQLKDIKNTRSILIKNGVENLKAFGYDSVNEDNILTDEVYSLIFNNMLDENRGIDKELDKIIDSLKAELPSE